MLTEWTYISRLEDINHALKEDFEIEVSYGLSTFVPWDKNLWSANYKYRARPRQPKMKKVKMLCYFDTVIDQLVWSSAEAISGDWIRVPSEDKEIEVQDDN